MLLDPCTLIWLAIDLSRLSNDALRAISANAGSLYVSAISPWELALKHKKQKLKLPFPPEIWYRGVLQQHGLEEIEVSGEIALASVALPDLHGDPADRIIVATSQAFGYPLITPDPIIRRYPNTQFVW